MDDDLEVPRADDPVDAAELAHAQGVLARYECHAAGHDFGIETNDHDGAPVRVHCSRPCGHGPWPIGRT